MFKTIGSEAPADTLKFLSTILGRKVIDVRLCITSEDLLAASLLAGSKRANGFAHGVFHLSEDVARRIGCVAYFVTYADE